MNQMEKKIAKATLQIKAEPFCTECGGSCLVLFENIEDSNTDNILSACTMCGKETKWTATGNHAEMLKRIAALVILEKGGPIKNNQHIRGAKGECINMCGGICPEHWRQDEEDTEEDKQRSDSGSFVLDDF